MNIIDPQIQLFAENFSSSQDPLLEEIEAFTKKHYPEHHMLSGHLQGKLLEMISWMVRPRRILEIGTFTGFSALCLAKGLTPDGKLHTIELRERDAEMARGFFSRSSFATNIILHVGNALDILPRLNETWDLVFIDADKVSYIEYFRLIMPNLRQNGFILADNIFFHGEALEENPKGKSAKAMKEFNELVRGKDDIDKVIITVRDGLYLIRKR